MPSPHNSGCAKISLVDVLQRARESPGGLKYLENGGVEVIPSISGESIKVCALFFSCAFRSEYISLSVTPSFLADIILPSKFDVK